MMQRTLSDCSFLRMDFLCQTLRYCTSTATAELCNNKRLTGTSFLLYLMYKSVINDTYIYACFLYLNLYIYSVSL